MNGQQDARNVIFTIGYQDKSLDVFIECLRGACVDVFIDVRELPLSRKRGFSKTQLTLRADREDFTYIHCKALGSPREIRHRLQKNRDYDAFFSSYHSYIQKQRDTLEQLLPVIESQRCCLMCYERDVQLCHRLIVAQELKTMSDKRLEVISL